MPKINPKRILHEDDHLLVVDKLSRELVVRGKGKMEKLPLLDFLRGEFGSSLTPIHRLDFETSGVVLFAKTKQCYDAAVTQGLFIGENANVRKTYRAIVMGRIKNKSGEIDKKLPARRSRDLIPSHTAYHVLRLFGDTSYVEAIIASGRFHQIRKHFASIGHPLVNDELYGNQKFNRLFARTFKFHYMFLHAYRVEFVHFVTGKSMTVTAPLPASFEKGLAALAAR